MILTNANIYTKEQMFEYGSVSIDGDKISNVDMSNSKCIQHNNVVDCNQNYLIPGLVDIHFHGCVGHDFCEGTIDALDAITSYELQNGITSICPATMTFSEDILTPVMKSASAYKNADGAEIVGINMEGPFISKEKIGAQNPKYVQKPDAVMIYRLQKEAKGLIKLIDVAPEVNGALDFIKNMSKDFYISIAHTNCDYETAIEAYKFGAKHLTHTYNAMPGIHHRKPGPIIAAYESGANAEIVCDGQHVNYAAMRLIFDMFKNRTCIISDTCEATGLKDGQYSLGGQSITKIEGKAVLTNSPDTIAASCTNLFECLKRTIFEANIAQEHAIAAATINPCKAIGVEKMYGSIETGKYANLLLLDKDYNIIKIFNKGKEIKRGSNA